MLNNGSYRSAQQPHSIIVKRITIETVVFPDACLLYNCQAHVGP